MTEKRDMFTKSVAFSTTMQRAQATVPEVELPLIGAKLESIDLQLDQDCWNFISTTKDVTQDLAVICTLLNKVNSLLCTDDMLDLLDLILEIMERLENSYLWQDNRTVFPSQFVLYGECKIPLTTKNLSYCMVFHSALMELQTFHGLVEVMNHLLAVRDRQKVTERMFDPLRDTIILLEQYGVTILKQSLIQKFTKFQKVETRIKKFSHITPCLASLHWLTVKQSKYLEQHAPFNYNSVLPVYYRASAIHKSINVTIPDYKDIKLCRREVIILKELWAIVSSMENWAMTKWRQINVDQMDAALRRFAKRLDDVYCGLDLYVKNLVKSLQAVSQLQNLVIEEHHCVQLIRTIQMDFILTVSEVWNMVDKADKEMATEKVQLQGIFQCKRVDHFLFHIVELPKQLTVADSDLHLLERIFRGCDDICVPLPMAAHRFQTIDELMLNSAQTKNGIEATNKPHLRGEFRESTFISSPAFPRLYCMSFADLLIIVSLASLKSSKLQLQSDSSEVMRGTGSSKSVTEFQILGFSLTLYYRQKIITICVIDVEARDVFSVYACNVSTQTIYPAWLNNRFAFLFLSSLPLTMIGALAGPAGTGRTEATKDLGRATIIMVYIFNYSEQMDYKVQLEISTRVWPRLDHGDDLIEFNLIAADVLSVVAVQDILLKPSVGIFITMNPAYEGRTELPKNLKGFCGAKLLAWKFTTLYTLCKKLLYNQNHAVKSVLVVARARRRRHKTRQDQTTSILMYIYLFKLCFTTQVLMRTLRDFNLPKIVTEDLTSFLGLLADSFPGVEEGREGDCEFEKVIQKKHIEVVQLEEVMAVRHSVLLVGNVGTGKDQEIFKPFVHFQQILRVFHETYVNLKKKPLWKDLNPKGVDDMNSLASFILQLKSGKMVKSLLSSVMREQANMSHQGPKWIVLDGDIDPMWIESLNTVMDDNKVPPSSRVAHPFHLFLHLRTNTLATASRAGILYVNQLDLEQMRKTFQTPIPDIYLVLVHNTHASRDLCETCFCFACIWAFSGSGITLWWTKEMKTVKLPAQGTVFDYYLDPQTRWFLPWSDTLPVFEMEACTPLHAVLVHTAETVRLWYFMDLLLQSRQPVMLVGNAGVGKTSLVRNKLDSLPEIYMNIKLSFNYYTTTSFMLQEIIFLSLEGILEQQLEKRRGRSYYDINQLIIISCQLLTVGTVQPHTAPASGLWALVACMNTTAGRFFINPRILIHFSVFAVNFPSSEEQHFSAVVESSAAAVVLAAVTLQDKMVHSFPPTAIKFHSKFIVPVLSSIFHPEGVKDSTGQSQVLSPAECTQTDEEVKDLHTSYAPVTNWSVLRYIHTYPWKLQRAQCLMRLAAYMSCVEVFQIPWCKGFSLQDLKMDLAALLLKTGLKNQHVALLLTDAQKTDDLTIGLLGTRKNCWRFLTDQFFYVVLCLFPVGNALYGRSRDFPVLIQCTFIDWIHPWTSDALQSVSYRFIQEIKSLTAYVHTSVNQASEKYLRNEKRYNYTTPKSFLHQMTLYRNLVDKSWTKLQHRMNQLDSDHCCSDGLDPILMITDDASVAAWHSQDLPNDRMSIENAAILTTSEHWPLIIDPQQQGIKCIRNRLRSELRVVQLGQKGLELTTQQNYFRIELKRLEHDLLGHLSAARNDFLGFISLVEQLENTRTTAPYIQCKVVEARENETKINEARELYRPTAESASLLFFIVNDLSKINPMYQFPLKTFNLVFTKAMERAEWHEDVRTRVHPLMEAITYSVFLHTSRGLFERDKLTFLSHIAFQCVESHVTEKERLPQDWNNKSSLLKLIILRALHPDRMTYALRSKNYQNALKIEIIGKYMDAARLEFYKLYENSGPSSSFHQVWIHSRILKLGFPIYQGTLHYVSLGQSQEFINVHLVARWLPSLDMRLEAAAMDSHPHHRVFISVEPPPSHEQHVIPRGILENAIKITNEPPTGMNASLHATPINFSQVGLIEQDFNSMFFSLCFFHACGTEVETGTITTPFCTGDLPISANVLYNYA
ncbi:hypothetical protein Q8A73_008064 [Channa argus]|nr:hypothetical protein Q8A73_008064 [Channa argus]